MNNYNFCPELKIELKRDQIEKMIIRSSEDCVSFFRKIWDEGMDVYESFFVIYLNRANQTIGWLKLSQGGLTGTVADPRLIFHKALNILATGMIIAHNHPSGNLQPSGADKALTKKINEIGKLFDIQLFDHIILTSDGFYSFVDDGELVY